MATLMVTRLFHTDRQLWGKEGLIPYTQSGGYIPVMGVQSLMTH